MNSEALHLYKYSIFAEKRHSDVLHSAMQSDIGQCEMVNDQCRSEIVKAASILYSVPSLELCVPLSTQNYCFLTRDQCFVTFNN